MAPLPPGGAVGGGVEWAGRSGRPAHRWVRRVPALSSPRNRCHLVDVGHNIQRLLRGQDPSEGLLQAGLDRPLEGAQSEVIRAI